MSVVSDTADGSARKVDEALGCGHFREVSFSGPWIRNQRIRGDISRKIIDEARGQLGSTSVLSLFIGSGGHQSDLTFCSVSNPAHCCPHLQAPQSPSLWAWHPESSQGSSVTSQVARVPQTLTNAPLFHLSCHRVLFPSRSVLIHHLVI